LRRRDKPPAPIVRLDRGRLTPVTAWDAELMDAYPDSAEFDLVHRSKRSTIHNGKYWAELGQIIKATDAYPSAEHMHRWIKMRLGYTETICDPAGNPIAVMPDSTAFDKMDQAAFNVFYAQAVRLVAEVMGIDMGAMRGA